MQKILLGIQEEGAWVSVGALAVSAMVDCPRVGSVAAPIHPGSIPSPGVNAASSVAQLALQSRTSIGAGISPVLLAHHQQQVWSLTNSNPSSLGPDLPNILR